MRIAVLFVVLVTFFTVSSRGNNIYTAKKDSTEKSIFAKGLDQYKLQKARHHFIVGEYQQAIAVYDELLLNNPKNPLVNYRLGECYYQTKKYDLAKKYFENALPNAEELEPEFYKTYALVQHRIGNFDEAIANMEKYKAKINPKKEKEIAEADKIIENLKFGKSLVEKPVDVDIKNMGSAINSAYPDYGPSVTADEKTIIFTSRRPDTKGGDVDPYDGLYYEDIYISEWDEENNQWKTAVPIPGKINTEAHDAALSISPDGNIIYVYKNFGENGSGEIYYSKKSSSGRWSAPKPLDKPINTSYWESSASLTANGKKLYFVSERKGGKGMGDIWVSERISKHEWGEPVNLGAPINTEFDEKMVFIHPDGNVLFFCSDGHKSVGGYDIYMSVLDTSGKWSEPINLGYPINTTDDDVNFVLSKDNKRAYYSGYRKNSLGSKDIYVIDVSRHPQISKIEDLTLEISGNILSSETGEKLPGKIYVYDDHDKVLDVVEIKDPEQPFVLKLRKGKKFTLKIKSSGYKTSEEIIDVPFGETKNKVSRNFIMKR